MAQGRATRERLDRAWQKANDAFQSVHPGGGGDVEQNPTQAVLGLGSELNVAGVVVNEALA